MGCTGGAYEYMIGNENKLCSMTLFHFRHKLMAKRGTRAPSPPIHDEQQIFIMDRYCLVMKL